jgi:hypothetical protein
MTSRARSGRSRRASNEGDATHSTSPPASANRECLPTSRRRPDSPSAGADPRRNTERLPFAQYTITWAFARELGLRSSSRDCRARHESFRGSWPRSLRGGRARRET